MSTPLDIIDQLPWELKARVEADEYFSDVTVVVFEELNVRSEVEFVQSVMTIKNGKMGAAVIVMQVVADDLQRGIQLGPMTLYPAFQVIESVELNRGVSGTRKSARQLARRVRDVIKPWGATGLVLDMKPDKPCIEPIPLSEKLGKNLKSYGVYFQCLEQTDAMPAQVGKPECSQAGGVVTLVCPTAGARIFFTVDGSYPSEQNPKAKLFTGEIDASLLAPGPTIRFCAYVPGMIASWVSAVQIEPNQ